VNVKHSSKPFIPYPENMKKFFKEEPLPLLSKAKNWNVFPFRESVKFNYYMILLYRILDSKQPVSKKLFHIIANKVNILDGSSVPGTEVKKNIYNIIKLFPGLTFYH